jgi:hypothetical protein
MTPAVAERMPSLFDVAVERPASVDAAVEHAPAPAAVESGPASVAPAPASAEVASAPAPAAVERAPSSFDAVGGEPTLDEVLSGVWEGLAAHRVEECPVCGGEMAPVYGVHPRPIGGRCRSCHSVLG